MAMKTKTRKALASAIRDLVREVMAVEVAGRLVFCRPGRHFALAAHVRGCSVCTWHVGACETHGGEDAAETSATHHAAWMAGQTGRRMYGGAHAARRAESVRRLQPRPVKRRA